MRNLEAVIPLIILTFSLIAVGQDSRKASDGSDDVESLMTAASSRFAVSTNYRRRRLGIWTHGFSLTKRQ